MDYRIEQLRFQVREDPSSRHFYQLGELLRRHGELGEAIEVLRAGLEHHSEYVAAWVSLGRALFQEERYDEARPAFTRALELDPENAVAATMLGRAAARTGDWDEAARALSLAATLVPSDEDLAAEANAARSQLEPEGAEDNGSHVEPLPDEGEAGAHAVDRDPQAPGVGETGTQGAPDVPPEGSAVSAGEPLEAPPVRQRSRELTWVSEEDPWLVIARGDTGVFQVGDDVFMMEGAAGAGPGPGVSQPAGSGDVFREGAAVAVEGHPGAPEETMAGTGPAPEEPAEAAIAAGPTPAAVETMVGDGGSVESSGTVAPSSTEVEAVSLPGGEIPLPTATLARLALEQGDLPLAEETARAVLKLNSGSSEARDVLDAAVRQRSGMTATPAALARRKVERLEKWLDRIRQAATARVS